MNLKKMHKIFEHEDMLMVQYDEESKIIHWIPKGKIPHECWRASFEDGFRFLSQNEVVGWINDCRALTCVKDESIDWLAKLCGDLVNIVEPPRIAFIEPLNRIGQIAIDLYLRVSAKENPGLSHGLFSTQSEAIKWIKGK